jgi:glycolate oxidase iron-sulfur subunit
MKSPAHTENLLLHLDYSVVQQCMHCGMCLSVCPTYDETKREYSSPRGRVALMRAIVDGRMEVNRRFAEELYFCLGCLACTSACPAGVDYGHLFEMARAEAERLGVLNNPYRILVRSTLIKWLFMKRQRLRFVGRLLWLYQKLGFQTMVRKLGLMRLAPKLFRGLEPLTPTVCDEYTPMPYRTKLAPGVKPRFRVGLMAGCVQDLVFADINRDTIYVLEQNGCEVVVPAGQECCGSLHGHNGEVKSAQKLARTNIDAFPLHELDAIVMLAGGCGSHARYYNRLLADDPAYAEKAAEWSRKFRDLFGFLGEIDFRKPRQPAGGVTKRQRLTYDEACHLLHGLKISAQPKAILSSLPGYDLVELPEASWCCGSAGIYNITQPELSAKLLDRKLKQVVNTGATILSTTNTGCMVQLSAGVRMRNLPVRVANVLTLLAEAYRAEAPER